VKPGGTGVRDWAIFGEIGALPPSNAQAALPSALPSAECEHPVTGFHFTASSAGLPHRLAGRLAVLFMTLLARAGGAAFGRGVGPDGFVSLRLSWLWRRLGHDWLQSREGRGVRALHHCERFRRCDVVLTLHVNHLSSPSQSTGQIM